VGAFAHGAIAHAAEVCGNRPVRSTATVGGNLCNALPSADMAPVLLALDATCFIAGEDSQESLPLTDFFVAPRVTALEGRLLAGLALPAAAAGRRCLARKLTRSAEDISLIQVAVGLDVVDGALANVRIALGAVAPIPLRSTLAEDQLAGTALADLEPDLVRDAAVIAAGESDPIDDHRASAEYRRAMVEVFTRRLLAEALVAEGWTNGEGAS
jgi:carbon-monoxide dehydrogenase medium subunit